MSDARVPPQSTDMQRREFVRDALPELLLIENNDLREAVVSIWADCWGDSEWEMLLSVPKHPDLRPERTLVDHSRSVAKLAVACAQVVCEIHGLEFDQDTIVASALLHDVSKMVEYRPDRAGRSAAELSELGQRLQHAFYGAAQAMGHQLSLEIIHAIVAHTAFSKVVPQTWEAVLVHYVDYLDSDALLLAENRPLHLSK